MANRLPVLTRLADDIERGQPSADDCYDLGSEFYGFDTIPDSIWNDIVAVMRGEKFISYKEAWNLFSLLDQSWVLMSEGQKAEVRPILESSAEHNINETTIFICCEILGGRYCDEEALATFLRWGQSTSSALRELTVYGLGCLAKKTKNQKLRTQAVQQLNFMMVSGDKAIQREAGTALAKVNASADSESGQ